MSTIKVALVCVAKWEDYYLDEWLEYNHKLGFDKIIMYQNDWRCDIDKPYLEKHIWDGGAIQLPIYNHAIKTHTEYDFVALIDCDEFIVLKKHTNIKDFIEDYKDRTEIIGLNWYMHGNLGMRNRTCNSLLTMFPMRGQQPDPHIKVIVRTGMGHQMQLPHNCYKHSMDTNGHFFRGPFNNMGPMDVAYISHFHNKTHEDWMLRCERGRVDCNHEHDRDRWDNEIEINKEVKDTSAYNFLYGTN